MQGPLGEYGFPGPPGNPGPKVMSTFLPQWGRNNSKEFTYIFTVISNSFQNIKFNAKVLNKIWQNYKKMKRSLSMRNAGQLY